MILVTPRIAAISRIAFVACLLHFVASIAVAQDWPQFLGPTRDAVYAGEAKLAVSWPETGPPVVWKHKAGEGFAGPVIADKKLILFHRIENRMVLEALDTGTGKPLWTAGYDTAYFDQMRRGDGSRATPAISGDKVIAYGPDGVLWCVQLADGKTLWQIDTRKLYKTPGGYFGRGCSPLIENGLILLNLGAPGHGIVAFDLNTGELRWRATSDEASYASPVSATINNKRHAFFFTRTGLVAVNPATGDVLFQHRWRSRQEASVNAASPLVIGDQIFLSASYETGAILLSLAQGKPEVIWSGDSILSSQYANIVHKQGHLFGFDGRNDFGDTRLRCIELKTGKVLWTQPELAAGPLLLAGDKLIALLESGEMQLLEATTKSYSPLAKAKLFKGPVRANPALVNGFLYVKDDDQLICLDLRAK